MKVRALTTLHDWTFGKGLNNYLSGAAAVTQDINTRLNSYLGDCFFDQGAGINWFGFVGGKNELGLNLAISSTILNTEGVLTMNQLSLILTSTRQFLVQYSVNTIYGPVNETVTVAI